MKRQFNEFFIDLTVDVID